MSETNNVEQSDVIYDVIVVGAGAAGVGVGITLQHVGIEKFVIVYRETVGASFAAWPAETRFITPSFPR
ncbi:MAG TPA: NAD(P)-binding domain-containing protein, partial [Candidatus Poseidoniaceae archaeon]